MLKVKYGSGAEDSSSQGYSYDEEKESVVPKSRKNVKRKPTDAKVPRNLPDKFYNEEGEVDLRQVTGDEAWKYFAAQGIKLPRFARADGK